MTATSRALSVLQPPHWRVPLRHGVTWISKQYLTENSRAAHWAAVKAVLRAPREKAAAVARLAEAEAAAAAAGLSPRGACAYSCA